MINQAEIAGPFSLILGSYRALCSIESNGVITLVESSTRALTFEEIARSPSKVSFENGARPSGGLYD